MKQLYITFVLAVVMSMAGAKAWGYDIKVENDDGVIIYYNFVNGGGLEVTYGDEKYYDDINIPEMVEYGSRKYRVISIGEEAFKSCKVRSVAIPNSVVSIGKRAFFDSWLESVPDGYSLTSIGDEAFRSCNLLFDATIGNSVTTIGKSAFYDCDNLRSVTIGNSVTTIENSAFSLCSDLTSLTIGNSVASIGERAFYCCNFLTSIVVEEGNSLYDSRDNCNAIIETATNTLVLGCHETIIPNSVTSIGANAFEGCKGLTSITIPNSVTKIGRSAFYGCFNLTSVTFGNSVTTIEAMAFQNCNGLTSVTIGNSVTTIGNMAFFYCNGLASVTIGNSVTTIGDMAFFGCSCLTSIVVEEGNSQYDSRNNCNAIIETATNTLVLGCQETIIPNSVTSIGRAAFSGCSGLTSVTIPNSVTTIGAYAFEGCSGLTSVTIPNSVTIVGKGSFYGCTNLTEVISLIEDPFVIDESTFMYFSEADENELFTDATLYVPVATKLKYESTKGWNEFKNIVERGISPVEDNDEVVYGDGGVDSETKLDGNVIRNIYYNISGGNGEYNSMEGCIVVTKPTDDAAINGKDIFSEDFKDNFTGIVFKVGAGCGTVKVEAKTQGTMVLKVKIGDNELTGVELEDRQKVSVPYNVSEPTYVYIYGGSSSAAGAKGVRKAAGDGEVKIYSISWTSGTNGIETIDNGQLTIDNSPVYNLNGQRVEELPTKKGVYIKNGRKVLVK